MQNSETKNNNITNEKEISIENCFFEEAKDENKYNAKDDSHNGSDDIFNQTSDQMDKDKCNIMNLNSCLDEGMMDNSDNSTIKEEGSNELGSFLLSEISENNEFAQENPDVSKIKISFLQVNDKKEGVVNDAKDSNITKKPSIKVESKMKYQENLQMTKIDQYLIDKENQMRKYTTYPALISLNKNCEQKCGSCITKLVEQDKIIRDLKLKQREKQILNNTTYLKFDRKFLINQLKQTKRQNVTMKSAINSRNEVQQKCLSPDPPKGKDLEEYCFKSLDKATIADIINDSHLDLKEKVETILKGVEEKSKSLERNRRRMEKQFDSVKRKALKTASQAARQLSFRNNMDDISATSRLKTIFIDCVETVKKEKTSRINQRRVSDSNGIIKTSRRTPIAKERNTSISKRK